MSKTMTRVDLVTAWGNGRRDFAKVKLCREDLSNLTLRKIGLMSADLEEANLRLSILTDANLAHACLRNTGLGGACLMGARLYNAILTRADFHKANLSGANLDYASLIDVCLRGARIDGATFVNAKYTVWTLLSANWGQLPEDLTLEAMLWDAQCAPGGIAAVDEWAKPRRVAHCPFARVDRVVTFKESKEVWRETRGNRRKPRLSPWQLLEALAEYKGVML